MQKACQSGLDRDALLPIDIHKEWTALIDDVPSLLWIQVSIYINAYQNAPGYLGFATGRNVDTRKWLTYVSLMALVTNVFFLLGSKTKLAPLNKLTIPRLKLNAAILFAQ